MKLLHVLHSAPAADYKLTGEIRSAFRAECEVIELYLYKEKPAHFKGEGIFLNSTRNSFAPLSSAKDIAAAIEHEGITHILSERYKPSLLAAIAASRTGIKEVYSIFHGLGEFDRLGRRIAAAFFMKNTRFIGVSDSVRNDLIKSCPAAKEHNSFTILNGIDLAGFHRDLLSKEAARAELGLKTERRIIGCVGRLVSLKGYDSLLTAVSRIPLDFDVAIVGEGRMMDELKKMAADLGLAERVVFTGNVTEAARCFKAFDYFAMPSRKEGFGLAALEAILADVPIVSSDAGGLPEVLGGQGIMHKAGDTDGLTDGLKKLLSLDESELKTYTDGLKKRSESMFSADGMQQNYRNLILGNGNTSELS
ncbi:MAG TPA: glycosyltransferase family 1 protein [Porticoccus sp.]|nr:glycosyltransferase family 1 protein [Porticoccus sp.]